MEAAVAAAVRQRIKRFVNGVLCFFWIGWFPFVVILYWMLEEENILANSNQYYLEKLLNRDVCWSLKDNFIKCGFKHLYLKQPMLSDFFNKK